MITNITASRAKRILASLKSYRVALPDDAKRIGLTENMESGEQLVGVYLNPPGNTPDEIYITTARLYLRRSEMSECIKYSDIKAVSLGEDGKASHLIVISCHDGTVRNVEIGGGEGKFRDSMAFLQFLDRAVCDHRMVGRAT